MMSQTDYSSDLAHLDNLFAVQVQQESGLLGPEPTAEEYAEALAIYNAIIKDSEEAGQHVSENTKVNPSKYDALERRLSIPSQPTISAPFSTFYSVLHDYCPTEKGKINVVHLVLNCVFGPIPSIDEGSKYISPAAPPKILPLPEILPVARKWTTYSDRFKDYMYLVLRHICEDFLTCFFIPLKMEGGVTRVASNWTSGVNSNDSEQGVKQRLSTLRAKCLERDDYRCVITKEFESSYLTPAVQEKLQIYAGISTEVAHIIPHGLNYLDKSSLKISDSAHYIWRIINMLDPGLSDILKGKDIDTVGNCMTLAHEIHKAFGKLSYYFDQIDGEPNNYYFRHAGGKAPRLLSVYAPTSKIEFSDHSRSIPAMALPSPRLLRFHRACCLILHMSGMAEYVDRLIDKTEDLMCQDVLSADGSSNLALLLAGKGNLTPPLIEDDADDADDVDVDVDVDVGEKSIVLENPLKAKAKATANEIPDGHATPFWGMVRD